MGRKRQALFLRRTDSVEVKWDLKWEQEQDLSFEERQVNFPWEKRQGCIKQETPQTSSSPSSWLECRIPFPHFSHHLHPFFFLLSSSSFFFRFRDIIPGKAKQTSVEYKSLLCLSYSSFTSCLFSSRVSLWSDFPRVFTRDFWWKQTKRRKRDSRNKMYFGRWLPFLLPLLLLLPRLRSWPVTEKRIFWGEKDFLSLLQFLSLLSVSLTFCSPSFSALLYSFLPPNSMLI